MPYSPQSDGRLSLLRHACSNSESGILYQQKGMKTRVAKSAQRRAYHIISDNVFIFFCFGGNLKRSFVIILHNAKK